MSNDKEKKRVSIDDQLYLLALVFTNSTNKLNYILKHRLSHINVNYVYKVPIYHKDNIVDELNNLMIINGCFNNLNEFIKENKLFQRLLKANNIESIIPSKHLFPTSNTRIRKGEGGESNLTIRANDDATESDDKSDRTRSLVKSLMHEENAKLMAAKGEIYEANDSTSLNDLMLITSANEKFEFITVNLESILQNDLLEETSELIYFELNLMQASVMMENEELLSMLLEHGASLKPLEQMKIHSIHLALYQNNTIILNMLLNKYKSEYIDAYSINTLTDNNGYNPLHIAIFNQNVEAIDLLCDMGADVNYFSELVGYPLIWAIENADISREVVRKLLERHADPNLVDKTQGYTALIVAILSNRLDLIQLLIYFGANVNQIQLENQGICPLKLAIDVANQQENMSILELLLSYGANPSMYSDPKVLITNETPDQTTTTDTNTNSTTNSDSTTTTTTTATTTNIAANTPMRLSSPLIDAIVSNNVKIIEKLIEFGANPSYTPTGSYSPICTACFLNRRPLVELLIKNNVDPTSNSDRNNTPLSICISQNLDELALYLLKFYKTSESLNRQDENGDFALLYAALNRNTRMVRTLIKAGANPDLHNKYGCSALWYSAYNNDVNTFMELVRHCHIFDRKSCGIDYNMFQWSPEFIYNVELTPIEVAERAEHYRLVYLFKCAGATLDLNLIENVKTKLDVYQRSADFYLNNSAYSNEIFNADNRRRLTNLIDELKTLSKSIDQPLSLQRLCRNQIKALKRDDKLSDKQINKVLPVHLKNFVSLKQV